MKWLRQLLKRAIVCWIHFAFKWSGRLPITNKCIVWRFYQVFVLLSLDCQITIKYKINDYRLCVTILLDLMSSISNVCLLTNESVLVHLNVSFAKCPINELMSSSTTTFLSIASALQVTGTREKVIASKLFQVKLKSVTIYYCYLEMIKRRQHRAGMFRKYTPTIVHCGDDSTRPTDDDAATTTTTTTRR